MFSLTPDRLRQLLGSSEARNLSAPAQERLRWIAEFVMSGQLISETCERMGIARSTFHRWLDRFDPDDLSTLEERSAEQLQTRGSTMPAETIALIRGYRERSPLIGKERIRELLLSEHGVDVSASSIGRTIERECLYFGSTPLHWRKRMKREERAASYKLQATSAEVQMSGLSDEDEKAASEELIAPTPCACAWCQLRRYHVPHLRRFIGIASLLVNIAVISMLLGTVFWEKQNEAAVRASLIHNASTYNPHPVSSLDGQ